MKKTYIKPENTVVCISVETLIAESNPQGKMLDTEETNPNNFGGREVIQQEIQAQDAWEMWE